MEGGQPRLNPNHLKPAANLEARGKNPRKGQENSRYQDQPTARVRDLWTQGRDELRKAAETAFTAHKRLRHRRPEAHPP